jgi:hypothetical protein
MHLLSSRLAAAGLSLDGSWSGQGPLVVRWPDGLDGGVGNRNLQCRFEQQGASQKYSTASVNSKP